MTSVYLTATQVAERLQVSVSWVYKHKHLLGAVRVGERMWRFPEQQLNAHLASTLSVVARNVRRGPDEAAAAREWRLTY
jgi:excisionase family DNA binding protein